MLNEPSTQTPSNNTPAAGAKGVLHNVTEGTVRTRDRSLNFVRTLVNRERSRKYFLTLCDA
eukprot:5476634-Prymnesium_polylepis.1